jgi:hypothetical protein
LCFIEHITPLNYKIFMRLFLTFCTHTSYRSYARTPHRSSRRILTGCIGIIAVAMVRSPFRGLGGTADTVFVSFA